MSIIKTSKHGIIVILALCILLCTTEISVHAAAIAEGTIVAIEATIETIEETTQELLPMMASRCDDYWAGQPNNAKSVSTSYLLQNGVNPHELKYEVLGAGADISSYNIYKDSNGGLWLYSGSGSYIPTYTYI